MRNAWAPFFDDVNAIIFLAPISCFNEKLAEDKRVNRLEDSFLLWRAICQNQLLCRTQLVLFLNKCDLLEKKLMSGVKVRHFVPSFGDRSNTLPVVAKCACYFCVICISEADYMRSQTCVRSFVTCRNSWHQAPTFCSSKINNPGKIYVLI